MTGNPKPQVTVEQIKLAHSRTVVDPLFDCALIIGEVGDKRVIGLLGKGSCPYKGKEVPEKEIELLEAALEEARAHLKEFTVKE